MDEEKNFYLCFPFPDCIDLCRSFTCRKNKTAKIGYLIDVSGPLSMYGQPITNAAKWAAAYINEVLYPDGLEIGGTPYHFKLEVVDYQGKVEEAPVARQRALDKDILYFAQFLSYIAKSMKWNSGVIVQGAKGEGSGTPQACATYLQAKEFGYTGYFCSYTGLTDIEARKILGRNYASFLSKVYQGEGVDAYTNPDPKVREWGKKYFDKFGEYPIDLVPWGWHDRQQRPSNVNVGVTG